MYDPFSVKLNASSTVIHEFGYSNHLEKINSEPYGFQIYRLPKFTKVIYCFPKNFKMFIII